MARSRNIKPGFFTNDRLAEVDPLGRLLFAGLWTIADREGRLEDRPKKIKAEVLPFDNCDIEALLSSLAHHDFIHRYEANGVRYIQIKTWKKHQNPHIKEAVSTIPAPCNDQTKETKTPDRHHAGTVQTPDKTQPLPERAGLIPDSLNLIPDSSKTSSSAVINTSQTQLSAAAPPDPENHETQGPTKAGLLASHLRRLQIDTSPSRAEIVDWALKNVPETIITEAVEIAKSRKPNARISSAYLAPIVEDLLHPRQTKPREPPWWTSEKTIEAKAREVGCWPARNGESWPELKQRIEQKISERQRQTA